MRLTGLLMGVTAFALSGCLESDRDSSFSAEVGGTVTGLSGEVTLVLNGGESLRVSANGSFGFSSLLPAEAAYSVTVGSQPAGQICSVLNGAGTMPYASISNIVVSCAAPSHNLGGNISGLIGSVTLSNGTDRYTTSTDGPFTFPAAVTQGAAFAVTVQTQPDTQTCSVSNGADTMGTSDIANVVVVCSTNTFAVGGSVSGLMGHIVLQINGGDALTISSNGAFEFPTAVAQGSPYAVTVQTQPATQMCSVSQGTGTVGAGDIANVAVVCSTNTFNLGGTVSGLSGTVVLQNNGGDDLTLNSDGAFTFPSEVAQDSSYAVTVLIQPTTQTCSVSYGTGTIGASDVSNVAVTCSINVTTLSVDPRAVIPVNGTGSLTVTNTGGFTAVNIAASLPLGWTSVVPDPSNCASLAPGASCTLSFTSPVPYVARDGIAITADNVFSPPTTALAFSIAGYLVFSVDSANTASVVDSAPLNPNVWSFSNLPIGAASLTDGAANTATIVAIEGSDAPAANSCNNSSAGGAVIGTWYLPAVCQLSGAWPSCPVGTPSVFGNLIRLGFSLSPVGYYWSSTEYTVDDAWEVYMNSSAAVVSNTARSLSNTILCARSISY